MKKALIVLVFLFSLKAFACLNGETKVLTNGLTMYQDHEGIIPRGHDFFSIEFEKVFKELDSLYNKTKKIEYLSDKGYLLVVQGKYYEALNLYLNIEKTQPNRYSTASNLGTIYELLGENEKALQWIKKAVAINPHSHDSSEWLHLKILEAKIDSSKLNNEFFIGTDFGKFDIPVSTLSNLQTQNLINSLYFQLNERMSFIKSKDSIIALLLFELGNLTMLQENLHDAEEIFKMASEYGYNTDLVKKRLSFINGFFSAKKGVYKQHQFVTKVNYEKTALLIISILLILIGLYFGAKKIRVAK